MVWRRRCGLGGSAGGAVGDGRAGFEVVVPKVRYSVSGRGGGGGRRGRRFGGRSWGVREGLDAWREERRARLAWVKAL